MRAFTPGARVDFEDPMPDNAFLVLPVTHVPQSRQHWDEALQCIKLNEPLRLARMLDSSPDVARLLNGMGENLLMLAAQASDSSCAHLLLPHSQCDILDFTGCGALTHAVSCEHLDLVQTLLGTLSMDQLRAQVDLEGWSPLTFAVYTGQPHMVDLLIDHGADATLINEDGDSLLTLACRSTRAHTPESERLPILNRLLTLCDPDFKTPYGWTALMLCLSKEDLSGARLLLPRTTPGLKNGQGYWPLLYVVKQGDERLCRLLAPIESAVVDAEGRNALMIASQSGDLKMVRLLLPHFDARATDHQGASALALAYMYNWWPCVDALCLAADPLEAACVFEAAGAVRMPTWAAKMERDALAEALGQPPAAPSPDPQGHAHAGPHTTHASRRRL